MLKVMRLRRNKGKSWCRTSSWWNQWRGSSGNHKVDGGPSSWAVVDAKEGDGEHFEGQGALLEILPDVVQG